MKHSTPGPTGPDGFSLPSFRPSRGRADTGRDLGIPFVGSVGQEPAPYNTQSSTTVRSVNSGAPSKISIMVALTA